MAYETLLVEAIQQVGIVTISRPEKRNALNATVRRELIDVLDAMRTASEVRVVVLTGAGDRAFVAGADIAEFAERSAIEQWQVMAERRVFEEVAQYPKPTVAMINGYALGGGCELAAACDLRFAARSARFGQPEIKLGILPGGGGTQRLPRLIGAGAAMRMILTGDLVDAEEALRLRLVDLVVDDAELRARTLEIAHAMAGYSPLALRLAKSAVRMAEEAPLSAGLAYERELFATAFASEDRVEGMRAFLEKRAPAFQGR